MGRAAACLDSIQENISEEWHENQCDKRGWGLDPNLRTKKREKAASRRETAFLLFRYALLHSARREAGSIFFSHVVTHESLPASLQSFKRKL